MKTSQIFHPNPFITKNHTYFPFFPKQLKKSL